MLRYILILDDFDHQTTAVVYIVGAKDMQSNARFDNLVGYTKRGKPRYFRNFDEENTLQGGEQHGYIDVAPHVTMNIEDHGEMSGTALRQTLQHADPASFEKIMGFFDPDVFRIIKTKLNAGVSSEEEEQDFPAIFHGLAEDLTLIHI